MLKKPIVLEIAENVYAINEFGLDSMFIVVGKESAAVIDTGMGIFDFKALIRSITDKPYVVLLTHGHLDHVGGMDQFAEVYLHKNDIPQALSVTKEARMDSCRRMRGLEGDADVWDYDESNCRKWKKLPLIKELEDGMIFDLGDRKIKTIFTPGHSKGSCSFIDSLSRILFSGDACNVNIMVTDCSVQTEYESMLHLKEFQSEFDQNFNGHLGFSSGMAHISMPNDVLDDIIEASKNIMDGTATSVFLSPSKRYNGEFVGTYLYGTISLTYRIKQIFKKEED